MKELSEMTGLTPSQVYKWKWDKQEAIRKYNLYKLTHTDTPFNTQKVESSKEQNS